ncbi:MAG: hypothetical protein COZ18_14145 [Flexibacter sp. CG_4_10_14_3_um_filter_32_15]|nr:MAG: hypothetical protein COZ18_14145 [Flexibacter sp. CG_4_10_14_3_um_filter_32_15]
MKDNKKTYWKDLKKATQTTAKGLGLTWEHFQKSIQSLAKTEKNNSGSANSAQNQSFDINSTSNLGVVTNRYPHEMMPIPDNGRYKLHNEIDDCIVCNKCAEVCPVNCIEIDAIRGTEQVGTASDGSPIRFYAATFDIDMAKCCFCGLCTVVCPTECLTMTKEFDFSETDIAKMNYDFSNLNDEETIQKQKEWDDFEAKKAAKKTAKKVIETTISKPLPKIKKTETPQKEEIKNVSEENKTIKKPTIKIKKITSQPKTTNTEKQSHESNKAVIKSKLKPIKIKLPAQKTQSTENKDTQKVIKKEEVKKESKKPIIKIKIPKAKEDTENKNSETQNDRNDK